MKRNRRECDHLGIAGIGVLPEGIYIVATMILEHISKASSTDSRMRTIQDRPALYCINNNFGSV